MSKIRVLSVDDSALMRQIMTEIINSHSDMEMVATAPDPLVAGSHQKFNPDVLTWTLRCRVWTASIFWKN